MGKKIEARFASYENAVRKELNEFRQEFVKSLFNALTRISVLEERTSGWAERIDDATNGNASALMKRMTELEKENIALKNAMTTQSAMLQTALVEIGETKVDADLQRRLLNLLDDRVSKLQ